MVSQDMAEIAKLDLEELLKSGEFQAQGIGVAKDPDNTDDHAVVIYVATEDDGKKIPRSFDGVKVMVQVVGGISAEIEP